ncbi:MAG: hypothetical protein GVY09_20055, partial [Gammaproteobacteria bacterium]|nr:hypothetical protein [Gammaproteobacteria bacterium]
HVLHLGLPDACVEQGGHDEQMGVCGLDAAGIEQAVRTEMAALKLDVPTAAVQTAGDAPAPPEPTGEVAQHQGAGPRRGAGAA